MKNFGIWNFCRTTGILAKKDLTVEFRRSHEVLSIFAFSVGSVLLASLSLQGEETVRSGVVAALLWIILFFAGILIFTTSFTRETDRGTLGGLKTLPCSSLAILAGKAIYGTILVLLVGSLLVPASVMFLHIELTGRILSFLLIYLLGAIGLSLAGSFVSGLVMFSEGKTLLLSFLLIPICIPVLLPSVIGTEKIIRGESIADVVPELRLIAAFLFLITAIMAVTFTFLFEE